MNSFTYDGASRLLTVSNGTRSVTYAYLANAALVGNLTFKSGSTTRLTIRKQYDTLNRLTQISNRPSASATNTFTYTYNTANQRTRVNLTDGSYWLYQYDALGQVTSGKKYWSDNTEVAGQQFGYDFDDIGNREQSAVSGRQSTYTANNLNQYTQRTVPGYIWELGSANSNATVTINLQSTARRGEYFAKEFSVANSSSAVYTQLVTVGVLKNAGSNLTDIVTATTGSVFVAQSPEQFTHDADGNLLTDGRWTYSWDAENRLIGAESVSGLPSSVPRQKLVFGYDSQSRRISKVVSNWTGSAWAETTNLRFVYDRWNLVAELNQTNAVVRSYTWGLDLSGTPQGAGGVGGLLAVTAGTNGTHFVAFDGNGNVAGLVNASTGAESARYEYGPFGEVIRSTGPAAELNVFRFSTKYADAETGLLYYGYRYYQPSTGRWLSRDPIGEMGGLDLYSFVANDPTGAFDHLGLTGLPFTECSENLLGRKRVSEVIGFRVMKYGVLKWSVAGEWVLNPVAAGEAVTVLANALDNLATVLEVVGAGGLTAGQFASYVATLPYSWYQQMMVDASFTGIKSLVDSLRNQTEGLDLVLIHKCQTCKCRKWLWFPPQYYWSNDNDECKYTCEKSAGGIGFGGLYYEEELLTPAPYTNCMKKFIEEAEKSLDGKGGAVCRQ